MKLLIFLSAISLSYGSSIDCFYSNESNWVNLGDTYTCFGVLTNYNNTALDLVTGTHQPGNGYLDVEMVYIANDTQLTFIPDVTYYFENIKALYLSSCNIRDLKGNELDNYQNLTWISLSRNKIEYIPSDFFRGTPYMATIFMYENRIKYVGIGLLSSLSYLTSANFNDNACISRAASTPNDLQWLMYYLTLNCSDDVRTTNNYPPETSTTLQPTTTRETTTQSPEPQTCSKGSINEKICFLEKQNEILLKKNHELNWKLDDVSRKLDDISENLFGFTQVQQSILMSLPLGGSENFGKERYEVDEKEFEVEEEN